MVEPPSRDQNLKCYALHSGGCWLHLPKVGPPVRLEAGDCVLLPGNHAFWFGSDAGAPPIDAGALFSSVQAGGVAVINGGGDCSGVGGFFAFEGGHADLLINYCLPWSIFGRRRIGSSCAVRSSG